MSNGVRPHKRDASLLQRKDYGNVQEYTLQKMWVSGYYYLLGMSNKRRSYGDGEIDGSEQMTMNMNMNAVKRNSNQT
jgi:hypothetical protein